MMQPSEFTAHVNQLTNHQWKLLESLIKANGQWLTRRQIATDIGKRRLIPYDMGCLKQLEERQLIEIAQILDPTPIGFQVVYRVTDAVLEAIRHINETDEG